MTNLVPRWHRSLEEIPKKEWDNLLGNQTIPFFQWNWLHLLEKSGSVSKKYGWQPLHLVLWDKKSPIAVAPLYLKNHSYGEFIFDQIFAELAGHLGLNYYPKLIGMSPLSPIEGYRFFFAKGTDHTKLTAIMMEEIEQFAIKNDILSCNFLYVDRDWCSLGANSNYRTWINQQSLWIANDINNFSDYLMKFNSNQRRNINRERKSIEDAGIKISAITGPNITQEVMQNMHEFYSLHCSRWGVWGSKYLTQSFFKELASPKHYDQLVLFSAHMNEPKNPLAMSLCVKNKNMLWGRYWGSKSEINNLHFELCYYSPIAWSLDQGINLFDPGAGGKHKRRRGFLSKPNYSLHRWYDKKMDQIITEWLHQANKMMIDEIEASNSELPFKVKELPIST